MLSLLALFACSAGPGDTGAGTAGGPLLIQRGEPEGYSDVVAYFRHAAHASADELLADPDLRRPLVSFRRADAPFVVPGLGSADVESCWLLGMLMMQGRPLESYDLRYAFGEQQVEADVEWDYNERLEGDLAIAAATPGTPLTLDSVETGLVVPEQLVLDDGAAAVTAAQDSGLLELRWAPPASATDSYVLFGAMAPDWSGVWCALEDDGAADVEVRDAMDELVEVSVWRVHETVLDHPSYGRTHAELTWFYTVELP